MRNYCIYPVICLGLFLAWPLSLEAASSVCRKALERQSAQRGYSRAQITAIIKALAAEGIALDRTSLGEEPITEPLRTIISGIIGRPYVARRLVGFYGKARVLFGSWEQAVDAAGIEAVKLRRVRSFTPHEIIAIIQGLHANGVSLSAVSIKTEPLSTQARDLIESVYGSSYPVKNLAGFLLQARKAYGTWQAALEAAGIDVKPHLKRARLSQDEIVTLLQQMHRAGLRLNAHAINKDRLDHVMRSLFSSTLRRNYEARTGALLYTAARTTFGSWDAALQAAGLNHHEIRLASPAHSRVDFSVGMLPRPSNSDDLVAELETVQIVHGALSRLDEKQQQLAYKVMSILEDQASWSSTSISQRLSEEYGTEFSESDIDELFAVLRGFTELSTLELE